MAARTKSKVSPKYKTKYRVKNWPTYEAALRKRGDVTLWFGHEAIEAWNAPAVGRPCGQLRYSDLAIVGLDHGYGHGWRGSGVKGLSNESARIWSIIRGYKAEFC
jgi:hypothetical protein